jgi:hypothetical protein
MPVHGSANFAATGTSAPLAKLILIAQREWVRARECAVSVHGLFAQRRTLVTARCGRVRTIACTDVPGSAIAAPIWTRDGTGDHPRVRRSRVDVTHGSTAGSVSAGRYDCSFRCFFLFFSFPSAILSGSLSLFLFVSFLFAPPFAAHMNGAYLKSVVVVLGIV